MNIADGPSFRINDAIRRRGPFMVRSFNRRGGRSLFRFADFAGELSCTLVLARIRLKLGKGDESVIRVRGLVALKGTHTGRKG